MDFTNCNVNQLLNEYSNAIAIAYCDTKSSDFWKLMDIAKAARAEIEKRLSAGPAAINS